MTDATEGVVAAITAASGHDKVAFAAWDRIVKDNFGGDDVAFNKRRSRQIAAPSFQTRHQALSARHQAPISHLGELLEESVVLLEALLGGLEHRLRQRRPPVPTDDRIVAKRQGT